MGKDTCWHNPQCWRDNKDLQTACKEGKPAPIPPTTGPGGCNGTQTCAPVMSTTAGPRNATTVSATTRRSASNTTTTPFLPVTDGPDVKPSPVFTPGPGGNATVNPDPAKLKGNAAT